MKGGGLGWLEGHPYRRVARGHRYGPLFGVIYIRYVIFSFFLRKVNKSSTIEKFQ